MRSTPDKSVAQLHADSALGALADAGLSLAEVDGYFCAGDVPGGTPLVMADYLNLRLRWMDGSELGGCSYIALVEHAAAAIAAGAPWATMRPPATATAVAVGSDSSIVWMRRAVKIVNGSRGRWDGDDKGCSWGARAR